MGVALSITLEFYKSNVERVKNENQKLVESIFRFVGVAGKS